MAYIPNSQENKDKGEEAEKAFYQKFRRGIKRKSSDDEDMKEHWDYLMINKDGDERRVDVKSFNKREHILRVEIVNRNGDHGWVYGKSDYIAYRMSRTSDKFLFVKTKALQRLAEKTKDIYVEDTYVPYRKWKQKGSAAVLTFIPLEDLDEKDYIEL